MAQHIPRDREKKKEREREREEREEHYSKTTERDRAKQRGGSAAERAGKSERMSIAGTAPFFKPRLLSI